MSDGALTTSEIEGEMLDRFSVQSSIKRQLGLASDHRRIPPGEQGVAEMTVNAYQSFAAPSLVASSARLAQHDDERAARPYGHRALSHTS